ncbi:hypothetical protein [Stieleria mannarensis]|uniref:hypothetical protein n=1 Tax=Stieleria mannarensis TaxID=2755585 RepID=UPI001602378E|nr:hypothetical protein [Rhodopirellula sp. JC639]
MTEALTLPADVDQASYSTKPLGPSSQGCCKVSNGNVCGSGSLVGVRNGRSLILTNAHVAGTTLGKSMRCTFPHASNQTVTAIIRIRQAGSLSHGWADMEMGMNGDSSSLPTWVTGGIVAIITSLASAVVFMFRLSTGQVAKQLEVVQESHTVEIAKLKSDRDTLKEEAARCRRDREELRVEIAEVNAQLNLYLELRPTDARPTGDPTAKERNDGLPG